TTKQHGSGLGLATVYSIVNKHLGRIEVRSKLGEGTTFDVWLPAAQHPPDPAIPPDSMPVRQHGRVLVMDDEPAIRESATALLERVGLETRAVGDGAAVLREYALAREAGHPFDVVILDLTVPGGMGGRETIEQLRKIDPQVRA